jgi:hypothetical protein
MMEKPTFFTTGVVWPKIYIVEIGNMYLGANKLVTRKEYAIHFPSKLAACCFLKEAYGEKTALVDCVIEWDWSIK